MENDVKKIKIKKIIKYKAFSFFTFFFENDDLKTKK